MTRLDASGEPSMEEILASIRRIIAEEPPGSRATTPPARSNSAAPAPAALDRAMFSRDAATPNAIVEPRPADNPAPAPQQAVDVRSSVIDKPSLIDPKAAPTEAAAALRVVEEALPPKAAALADAVAAQMSDLLDGGDTLAVDADKLAAAPLNGTGNVSGNVTGPTATEQPGFTVSRDGYVPRVDDDADPFDFDLGPSPFSRRAEPRNASVATPAPVVAKVEIKAEAVKPVVAPAESAAAQLMPTKTEAPDRASIAAPPSAQPVALAVKPVTVQPLAAPSIAATLPPQAEIDAAKAVAANARAKAEAAAVTRSVDMMSSRSSHDPIHDVVTEAVNVAMARPATYSAFEIGERTVAVEVDDAFMPHQQIAVRDASAHGASVPALRNGDASNRSMEDTVADLLRPMLKSWLSENMPKIIERALRREISEMSLPQQHKTAAE